MHSTNVTDYSNWFVLNQINRLCNQVREAKAKANLFIELHSDTRQFTVPSREIKERKKNVKKEVK